MNRNREVWRLAGPIMISNVSVPLVGAVDTAVVGHLPDPAYIGAVALGAVIFSLVFWAFGFLRMTTTGFVAQAVGANDHAAVANTLLRALLLAVVFGLLILLLQTPIGWLAFFAIDGEPELEALALDYFSIRIWGAPAALANYAILGGLIGIRDTRAALYSQLVLNGSNMALDWLFVVVLGGAVDGVALASVISEYLAVLVGGWLLLRGVGWTRPPAVRHLFAADPLKKLFRANADVLIRTLCLSGSFFYFTATGAQFGDTVLAANAILLHLYTLMAHGLDGFAHAAEALAGAAYGARDRLALRAAVRTSTLWALAMALAICLLYWAFGRQLVGLMTDIEAVRTVAAQYLPWILVAPVVSVWSFQLDGIFIGTTRTTEMRNAMMLSVIGFLFLHQILTDIAGNHGLWLALTLFMALRALTLAIWYPRIRASLV